MGIDPVNDPWSVSVAVSFSYGMSKNAMWRRSRTGGMFLAPDAEAAQDEIVLLLRQALAGVHVARNRLWVRLHVQKPDHRGDALNVIDVVCDAIQRATGLDDRWYELAGVSWEIIKESPKVRITVGQDDLTDVQPCSGCGRLLPSTVDFFYRNASAKTGFGGRCKDCRDAARRGTGN